MKMKLFTIIVALLFSISLHAQNYGKLISKNLNPGYGVMDTFVYIPGKFSKTPDTVYASIVYKKPGEEAYYYESIPVYRLHKAYQFCYKPMDFTQVLIMGINDQNRNLLDNNNEFGFTVYLYNQKVKVPPSAYLEAMDLLSYYARLTLKLNREKLRKRLIDLYEEAYKLSPSLKKNNYYNYNYYLNLLYQENKEKAKPLLLAFALKMALTKKNEENWVNAMNIYQLLQMQEEQQKIARKALTEFPNGKVAQTNFWDSLNTMEDITEQGLLRRMNEYEIRFKDSSLKMKNNFYFTMIRILIKRKEWEKIAKYEQLIDDKIRLTNLYNRIAQQFCDDKSNIIDSLLNIARVFSLKALFFTKDQIDRIQANKNDGLLQSSFNRYADTYAQILYKLKIYDSAFYYLDGIYKQGCEVDENFLDRYTTYAEKAKGIEIAYQIIEEQFLHGKSTPGLLSKLKLFSKQFGMPDSTYNLLRDNYVRASSKKMEQSIIDKFGVMQSKGFSLRDINNFPVSVGLLKGKVIILDFWATWCIPCRASFPSMQEIVNKYKGDTDVVFLFIDTWENIKENEIRQNVAKFLKENNYTFRVLIDDKSKVADKYRLSVIPSKFIIDKKGNITFMSEGETSDFLMDIDNAKK